VPAARRAGGARGRPSHHRRNQTTTIETPVDNGVNVEALLGVRDALPETPEIAQFQWRSTTSWVNGTHSRCDVETFYGFGEEQRHHATFSYDVDHPLQFAAQDNGITPVEYVLADAGPEEVTALVAQSPKRSAVYDILTNPTSVCVRVA
jgi:hypothetical protein